MSNTPKKILLTTLLGTSLTLGMATASLDDAKAADGEKCYGVAKAGMNDCKNSAGTHSCAGQSTKSGDPGEWLLVPAGLCERLHGGSASPKDK